VSLRPAFELGINYWPRRSAMHMWRRLDLGEVREDMARIADMGFHAVRLFALTRDFLPAPDEVRSDRVAALAEVVGIAHAAGLGAVPTVVVINMSGAMWWPGWMLDATGLPGDLYGDPALLRAQERLVRACAEACHGAAPLRAFDLANEIDGAQLPRTREAARGWTARLAAAARSGARGVPLQIGTHLPSIAESNNMRVDDLGIVADEDVMHAYPLYCDAARGPLDAELVPFSCALTAALAGTGRRVLMQEFGLCTAAPGERGRAITDDFLGQPRQQYLASEEEAATYYDEVLERLVATGAAGAWAWCWADYDRALLDTPPFDRAIRERSFGLVRADGSEKPAALVFGRLRRRIDAGDVRPGAVPPILDVDADVYYRAPEVHFRRLYRQWCAS
jgi:endo-1,4-beta-mannosidase